MGMVTNKGWISVKERLPKDYGTHIVACYTTCAVWFMDYYGCGWESCYSDGEFKIHSNDVTHWMPLPSPPSRL